MKTLEKLWPLAAGCLVFGLDFLFPYGYALWLGYMLILIALPIRTPPGLYAAAFVTFVITGGFKDSDSLVQMESVIFNRISVCAAIGVIAAILHSRRRLYFEVLAARGEAEEASKAKGRFMSYISHDLRTPLNGILARVDMLLQNRSITDSARRDLQYVDSQGWLLNEFIHELLDYSDYATAREPLELDQVDVGSEIVSIQRLFEPLLHTGVSLEVHADGNLFIRTDRRKLKHVLINLVGNAAKFTQAGSISIRAEKRAGIFSIEVEDTGSGGDAALLSEMFREGMSTDPARGLGLGLPLSAHFAGLLGGILTASSEGEGLGMKVRLELPA